MTFETVYLEIRFKKESDWNQIQSERSRDHRTCSSLAS